MGGPPGYIPEHQTWHVHLHPDGYLVLEDEDGNDPLRHPVSQLRILNWFKAAKASELAVIVVKAMRLLHDIRMDRQALDRFIGYDPDFDHLHAFFVCVLRQTEPNREEVQRMVTATRYVPLHLPAPLIELELRRKEA